MVTVATLIINKADLYLFMVISFSVMSWNLNVLFCYGENIGLEKIQGLC